MAGIGFVIKKLCKEDNLNGVVRAYFHAIVAVAGPWIFTCLAIATIFITLSASTNVEAMNSFRAIILYNFCFSLVFSAPFIIIATRQVADSIYVKDLRNTTGFMVSILTAHLLFSSLLSAAFYFGYTGFSPLMALLAVINFILISMMWLSSVYLSLLKYFQGITFSYLVGIILSVVLTILLYEPYGSPGMLIGFNGGLTFIVGSIFALILTEYPPLKRIRWSRLRTYSRTFWGLALSNFIFVSAIWVDKWVMWFSPEAITLPEGLILYPYYDSATFVAYLTIIPSMAMFLLSQETLFYEKYVRFYQDINEHANFTLIEQNRQLLESCLIRIARNIFFLQGGICLITILIAPKILPLLSMNFGQIAMFRFGVLGATFQAFVLYLTIMMAYFEDRRGVYSTQALFFVTNLLFSIASMKMGFAYYGTGFFYAALVTFAYAAFRIERLMGRLPYHAFITSNTSVAK